MMCSSKKYLVGAIILHYVYTGREELLDELIKLLEGDDD